MKEISNKNLHILSILHDNKLYLKVDENNLITPCPKYELNEVDSLKLKYGLYHTFSNILSKITYDRNYNYNKNKYLELLSKSINNLLNLEMFLKYDFINQKDIFDLLNYFDKNIDNIKSNYNYLYKMIDNIKLNYNYLYKLIDNIYNYRITPRAF